VAIPAIVDPTSVALDAIASVRVVAPVDEHGELALYGFSFDGTGSDVRPPATLFDHRRVDEDTSPVLVNDWLFFAEDNLRGGGRIRKAKARLVRARTRTRTAARGLLGQAELDREQIPQAFERRRLLENALHPSPRGSSRAIC